jgi:IclR family acetate operon transcriptional repressor
MAEGAAASNMRSLDRAIDVLEVLDGSTQPLRLTEIARRAGLHVATTQRILQVLEARGRVERDESGGYRAGLALLFGAHAYLASSPLVAAARPVLQDLASATGLTSSLFARTGFSRAVISRIEGSAPMRYVLPTGERLPLTLGAGKVLAAYLQPEELEEALALEANVTPAVGERVSDAVFREEMARIRRDGFYYSAQGRAFGVASVTAPILDSSGECIAGVQVAGDILDLTEDRVPKLSIEVRRAASAIAERIG